MRWTFDYLGNKKVLLLLVKVTVTTTTTGWVGVVVVMELRIGVVRIWAVVVWGWEGWRVVGGWGEG